MAQSSFLAIGLMSGTSMDGIDGALIETDGRHKIREISYVSIHYEPDVHTAFKFLKHKVMACQGDMTRLTDCDLTQDAVSYFSEKFKCSHDNALSRITQLKDKFHSLTFTADDIISISTQLHGDVVQSLIDSNPHKIDVIGYHGQTLYHNPHQKKSIQIGNSARLFRRFNIPVVSNFRQNDIDHGGQGAPLAPLYHQALAIRDNLTPLAVVNCGGISNITLINDANPESLKGFDTGPGNNLIDRFVQLKTDGQYLFDMDGQFGSKGTVNQDVLNQLLETAVVKNGHNYFKMLLPKSLDVSDLKLIQACCDLSLNDGCAILEAFTVHAIVDALQLMTLPYPQQWILAGGGWNNPVIINGLKKQLSLKIGGHVQVNTADEIGWNNVALEAQAFAYFAVRYLENLPISFPNTTGVDEPTVGGVCHGL